MFPLLLSVIAAQLTKCPSYTSLYDQASLSGYQQAKYQGEWYQVADTEPTEPSNCRCDRMTWLYDEKKPGQFKEQLLRIDL